ncbi:MAG: dTMP kinase [bacterium]
MEGCLIVFEGIDGSGKSRQARRIYNRLRRKKYSVHLYSEPTDGYYGRKIREFIQGKTERPDPEKEVELFIKDREDNIRRHIKPALLKNNIIILDRYYYSTIAYQAARGVDPGSIRLRNERIAPRPDLVILLEVTVEEGLRRIKDNRKYGYDRYEEKEYLERVTTFYKNMPDKEIVRVNAQRSIGAIDSDVNKIIDAFFMNHLNT